jgi:hypothetical protein
MSKTKKTRIRREVYSDGRELFVPELKGMFFWNPYWVQSGYEYYKRAEFISKQRAIDFLNDERKIGPIIMTDEVVYENG